MTPYPHPHGDSSLKLVHRGHAPGFSLIETTLIELPSDKLAALMSIAGVLNEGCQPGWVEYRSNMNTPDDAILDKGSKSISLSVALWLFERGLLEDHEMDYHETYHVSARGKRVVELAAAQEVET